MQFFSATTSKVPDGPGGQPLTLVCEKQPISEQEFTQIINDFVESAQVSQVEKDKTRNLIWKYLHEGKPITIGKQTLSIKK